MTNDDKNEVSLLDAMREALKDIKSQSPEEYVANVQRHKNGSIATAM